MQKGDVFVCYINDWDSVQSKKEGDFVEAGYYVAICNSAENDCIDYSLISSAIVNKKDVSSERWHILQNGLLN
jgi:hypothetical protein